MMQQVIITRMSGGLLLHSAAARTHLCLSGRGHRDALRLNGMEGVTTCV